MLDINERDYQKLCDMYGIRFLQYISVFEIPESVIFSCGTKIISVLLPSVHYIVCITRDGQPEIFDCDCSVELPYDVMYNEQRVEPDCAIYESYWDEVEESEQQFIENAENCHLWSLYYAYERQTRSSFMDFYASIMDNPVWALDKFVRGQLQQLTEWDKFVYMS